ncbi:MAG: NYN domain-containing protein [Burkholderiaceae bacterium]|nr:NYN domain-containing protein [Burkholderiaceae bacterium]
MKIDDHPVSNAVLQAWKTAVTHATPKAIHTLATQDKSISMGYRVGKVDLGIARTRIQKNLERMKELAPAYRDFLACSTLFSALVNVLSEQALAQLEVQWCDYFGRTEMVAAMLLDERAAVRAMAHQWLPPTPDPAATPTPTNPQPSTPSRQQAAQALQEELRPLLAHLHTLSTDAAQSSAPATVAAPTAPAPCEERSSAQEQLLAQALRDKDKEIKQLRRELRAETEQHQQQSHALAATQRALETAQTNATSASAHLAALQAQWDERVAQRVHALLDERLLPWLRPAETLADQVNTLAPSSASLLEQAQAVLQKQAATDRQHGLRSQLQTELADCQEAYHQLELARRDCLRPLPELATTAQKLQAHIRQLEKALQTSAPAPLPSHPLLCQIEQALARTHDLQAIAEVRRALQASAPLGWLPAQAQEQAYQLIDQASSKIYAVVGAVQGSEKNRRQLRALPLRALQTELAQARPVRLVVDGHNVLYTQTAQFKALYDQGRPEAKAREDLGQKLVALGQRYPTLSIDLWFDGAWQADKTLSAHVREHYSGGHGTDRADQRIVAHLQHLQNHNAHHTRAVVTADQDEALQAESTGALVIAPPELMLWLRTAL